MGAKEGETEKGRKRMNRGKGKGGRREGRKGASPPQYFGLEPPLLTFTKFQDRNVSMQCPMAASVLAGCVFADFLHCLPSAAAAAAAAAKTQQRRSDAPLEDSDPHQRRCTMIRYDTRRYFNVRSPRATFSTSGSS